MSEMADPVPENITGEKSIQYSHEIHHQINWGYVAIGAAVIAVVLWLWSNLDSDSGPEQLSAMPRNEGSE